MRFWVEPVGNQWCEGLNVVQGVGYEDGGLSADLGVLRQQVWVQRGSRYRD